eukprot:268899_1
MHYLSLIIRTICAICISLIITGIIVNYINIYKSPPSIIKLSKEVNHWKSWLIFLTNISILAFLLHGSSVGLIRFNIYPSNDTFCIWMTRINIAIYHCSRCAFYALLITRIQISFKNSIYKYNIKLIITLFIIIFIFFLVAITSNLVLHQASAYYDEQNACCVAIYASWGIIVSGSFDFIYSIICLILFIRPLLKLRKQCQIIQPINNMHSVTSELPPIDRPQLAAVNSTTATMYQNKVTLDIDIVNKKNKKKKKRTEENTSEL